MSESEKSRPTASELVSLWGLELMATENVMFSQTYVASTVGADGKALSTAIVGLLTDDSQSYSDIHRLPTDEIWHFYLGDPIELLLLHPDGTDDLVVLGQDVMRNEEIQFVVPAGVWMGAKLQTGGEYGVFGNTMAPGYSLSDFEGAVAEDLIEGWPHRSELIRAMIRPDKPIRYFD